MDDTTSILNENFYNEIDRKIDKLDDLHLDKLLGYSLFADNARKLIKTKPSITHRIYYIIYKCLSNGYDFLRATNSVDVIIATCIKTHNTDLLKQKYFNPCHVIQFDGVFALLEVIYKLKYGPKFCELLMNSSNKDIGTIFFQKAITLINIKANQYLQELNLINKDGSLTNLGNQVFPILIYDHNIDPYMFDKYTGFNLLQNIYKAITKPDSMYSHVAFRYVAIYLFLRVQSIKNDNKSSIQNDLNILFNHNLQRIIIPNCYYEFLRGIKQVNKKLNQLHKLLSD